MLDGDALTRAELLQPLMKFVSKDYLGLHNSGNILQPATLSNPQVNVLEKVVLFLDNVDEIDHDHRGDEARQARGRDLKLVLGLRRAPIGLVMSMNTFVAGILPREIVSRRVLQRLPAELLFAIWERRVVRMLTTLPEAERERVGRQLWAPETVAVVRKLAAATDTPLALLIWFRYLAEEDLLSLSRISEGLERLMEIYCPTVSLLTLRQVAAVFDTPQSTAPRDRVLAACDYDESTLVQLQERQVILPRDFWHSAEFVLNPEIRFLHPQVAALLDG